MAPPPPLQGEAFHDPSNTGPRPTPQIPTGGTFSVYAATHIHAPPAAVYDALLDIQKWKEWNTFVFDVTITAHPHAHHTGLRMMEGTNMLFHVAMTPDDRATTSKEACSHVEPLKPKAVHGPKAVTRIRWNLHNAAVMAPGFVIKAERVNEIEEAEGGGTLYRTWETFGGLAAKTVKKKHEQNLKDRFADWCADLKKYVEGKQAGGQSGVGGEASTAATSS
ncbi:hypothetical protein LTR36_008314 [Oleoguttula mirabilis]|uniref:Uncharacterized protein n=1 Tax=Oleoguttula mirabilis TaxID=1507867 RepID=A0AAV9J8J2_9PEZI|nr:hypothetical protein LTR36_008314 [Oleoguttula mirabilis]